jgi:hypothetical protein
MAEYLMFVQNNAVEGRDAEFNAWYQDRHVYDLLAIPGITAARRFELATSQLMPADSAPHFAAIYQIETDDLSGVLDTIRSSAGTPNMPRSDAMAPGQTALVLSPLGDLVKA